MSDYIMLLRGDHAGTPSPEELQARLSAYRAWVQRVMEADQYVEGVRLHRDGVVLQRSGAVRSDGPFVEAKELIAGIVRIRAADLDEALSIARSCPLHAHFDIELRAAQDDR